MKLRSNDTAAVRKRGRPRRVLLNPAQNMLENVDEACNVSDKVSPVPCKRGRPRRVLLNPAQNMLANVDEACNVSDKVSPVPCKRGRPRRVLLNPAQNMLENVDEACNVSDKVSPVPCKRGRSRRVLLNPAQNMLENVDEACNVSDKVSPVPCKRGRPRRVLLNPAQNMLESADETCQICDKVSPVPCKQGPPRRVKLIPSKGAQEQIDKIKLQNTDDHTTFKSPIINRKSTLESWKRVFCKYSPTTETTMSPIKAQQANLGHGTLLMDSYVDIYVWVVNMSEQFYYDNAFLLLNRSKSDPRQVIQVLRRNYRNVDIKFFFNLVEIALLGKGSFGSVYSCVDVKTKTKYAVKYISPKYKKFLEHCDNILEYMVERNSVIRAMNSPFVTNFYYSLKLESIGGLFLFFEFCIGDLYKYVTYITLDNYTTLSKRLYKNDSNIIQDLDKDLGLLEVGLIYIFELFCALDFLAKANIIHQDIKPANLMVSQTLHIKIGDFGVVYKTRTIHRDTNSELVSNEELNLIESSNYELTTMGTPFYFDFELLLDVLKKEKHPIIAKIKKNNSMFNIPGIKFDEDTLAPTFLTDTWAAGMVAVNLLFRGFDIFDSQFIHPYILLDVPRSNPPLFTIHLTARETIYSKYIWNGLIKSGGEDHKELMQFLASIFRPRSTRVDKYTTEKSIFRYVKKRTVKHVDMDKFMKIKSFRVRNFTAENIFTLEIPEMVRNIFEKTSKKEFSTFQGLLDSFSKKSTGQNIIDLKPGLTINNFP